MENILKTIAAVINRIKIGRLNLGFVAISIILLEFSVLIFPELRKIYSKMGTDFGPVSEYSFAQCRAIEMHPRIALVSFICYFAISVVIGNQKVNSAVNTALLFYFALILLGLGQPLSHVIDNPAITWPGKSG